MHQWFVGDVRVVRIEDLDFALASERPVPAWCVPHFAPSTSEVAVAFSALAVESDHQRIVVDPWLANDFPRDEPDASAHAARLLEELERAGFPADDVDLVVNTHLDGVGWNSVPYDGGWVPAFANARYLYPADEMAAVDRGEDIYGREALADLRTHDDVETFDPPLQLTSAVSLVDAPGHNFGHVAVRIESGGDLAIYPGHLVLSPHHVDDVTFGDDAPEVKAVATATRLALFDELAARHGLLLTTLVGGAGAGRVRKSNAGYWLDAIA
jgi:glyoxylase-like metal-dependent hydrolase (beta-lactamase superfamily II)